jgi:hypothetical protein
MRFVSERSPNESETRRVTQSALSPDNLPVRVSWFKNASLGTTMLKCSNAGI